jgi:heme-degrading monooxygenase HmoA
MIVRTWVAYARPGNARAYREHLKGAVLPQLRKLEGFLGLSVCQAERGDRVEILVISRWASLEAIKSFAGPKPERAVIDPGAKAYSASSTISPRTTRCCWRRPIGHDDAARGSGKAYRRPARWQGRASDIALAELTVVVVPDQIVPCWPRLRDDSQCQFEQLIDICGVDYPERAKRFDVVYHLLSRAAISASASSARRCRHAVLR